MEEDINIIVNKIKEKDKRKGSDAPKGGCWNPQINLSDSEHKYRR